MLQVAEFAELEVAEFAVLRGAQLSEKCLHNLLNTKPLHFSGKVAIIWFVEQNPSQCNDLDLGWHWCCRDGY